MLRDRLVNFTRSQIEEIANAYQARRNSRLLQLCETVTVRKALATDDKSDVQDAILPGPSQFASATLPAILDLSLNCTTPRHTDSSVPTMGSARKCKGGALGLDGRVPLPDSWAALAGDDDCDPLRVVDVNTLP